MWSPHNRIYTHNLNSFYIDLSPLDLVTFAIFWRLLDFVASFFRFHTA